MDAITDRFNAYMDPERYTFTPEGYVVDKYGLDAAREHVSIGAEGVELSSVDEDDLGEEGGWWRAPRALRRGPTPHPVRPASQA